MELSKKNCIPCKGGVAPLERTLKNELLDKIHSDWSLIEGDKKLKRSLATKEFKDGVDLAQLIAHEADQQWHHPDLLISFGRLEILIWTHKINDLVESDYIFAAKVDKIIEGFYHG